MGDAHVGLQARLMSQALRKLTGAISRSKTSVVFTNQLREKVGVMFGNPETTPGGRALKFYALGAPRRPPHRVDQAGHRRRRQPDEGPGRQEQGRAAVPASPSSTSCTTRASRRRAACSTSASSWRSSGSRRVLLLRRHAPRPGPRERQGVPRARTPRSRDEIERQIREQTLAATTPVLRRRSAPRTAWARADELEDAF